MAVIDILYFAWVRERVGMGHQRVSLPPDLVTVAQLIDWLSATSAGHAAAFADHARLRAAIDQRFVPLDASIIGAREVALFPPVTGG